MPRKQNKQDVPPEEQCMNRLTSEKTIHFFGDGKHKFFLEQRCTDRRMDGKDICLECSKPNTSSKQYARTFPRGRINEPLPPTIHLFDSEWYHRSVKKWGEPSDDVIAKAYEFQRQARGRVNEPLPSKVSIQMNSTDSPTHSNSPSSANAMPRRKPKSEPAPAEPAPEPAPAEPAPAKPEPAEPAPEPNHESKPEPEPEPELTISDVVPKEVVKRAKIKRPVISKATKATKAKPVPESPTDVSTSYPPSTSLPVLSLFQSVRDEQDEKQEKEQEKEQEEKKTEKKRGRKPSVAKKKESVEPVTTIVHKDSCIPTHLEEAIEEQSISDYETETVALTIFILDNVVYFRDKKKNKLYRRIREKTIGQYIGRYDPMNDSIVTDIPDSDEE